MSAHSFPINLDRALRVGFFQIPDPGAAGTFGWSNNGSPVAIVTTAGAEERTLPSANNFGVGTRLLVILATAGAAQITYEATNHTLEEAGDVVEFVVTKNKVNADNEWKILANVDLTSVESDVADRVVAAGTDGGDFAAADLILVAGGNDKTAADSAIDIADLAAAIAALDVVDFSASTLPVDLGTVEITTGHQATSTALALALNTLKAVGIFDGTITAETV
jgi:hypothetical protein